MLTRYHNLVRAVFGMIRGSVVTAEQPLRVLLVDGRDLGRRLVRTLMGRAHSSVSVVTMKENS
jgi:hypothetical protein